MLRDFEIEINLYEVKNNKSHPQLLFLLLIMPPLRIMGAHVIQVVVYVVCASVYATVKFVFRVVVL